MIRIHRIRLGTPRKGNPNMSEQTMNDYWSRMRHRVLRAAALLMAFGMCGTVAFAQAAPSRFELGHRLRRLERSLEFRQELGDRAVVLPDMEGAVKAFFGMSPAGVARSLDGAYSKLLLLDAQTLGDLGDGEQALLQEHVRVVLRGKRFLQGPRPLHLKFELADLYPATSVEVEAVESEQGARKQITMAQVQLLAADGALLASMQVPLTAGEFRLDLPEDLGQGDYTVRLDSRVGDVSVDVGRMQISWVADMEARLAKLEEQLTGTKTWGPDNRASVEFGLQTLRRAFSRQTSEMDLPALRVLQQCEALASHGEGLQRLSELGEEFWLSLRGQSKRGPKGRGFLRVFQPDREAGELRPCVIALHGAGGSENLFFDGYGDGLVQKLCEQRGWVLIAPRGGFTGIGLPFRRVLELLQEPLGIDPSRIFLVGHSMGVGSIAAALRESKEPSDPDYLGVAAIGGGMASTVGKKHLATPFLVVAGSHDFALGGARALQRSLVDQEFKSRFVELPQVEHMGVVQFALPQVFEFFDACLQR
ncbi:MAG: putative esterase [Glaciecola sp.]|jgi:predicted esterase